jgi:hypothetical protein
MARRIHDPLYNRTPEEGSVWERTRKPHEHAVRIVKVLDGRLGRRYLVEGVESGRQWTVSHPTLQDTYTQKRKK